MSILFFFYFFFYNLLANLSDMNVIAKMPGPRRHMSWALPRAERIAAVSRALGDSAIELGVDPERIDIVMNGVDGDLFFPSTLRR